MDTKALRQKVLDLAIRGKLVPQDPNDEPASVLLERIRQQKQQMVKDGKLKAKDIKNDTIIFIGEDNLHYEKFADGSVKCIEDEIPFDLPDGWAWARLQSITSILTDGTHKTPQYSDDGYIFLSSRNVTTGKIDWDNIMYIPETLHQELYTRLAPKVGDILLAKNGTTGVAAIVDREEVFDIYVSLALIRIVENTVDPTYVLRAIGSSYIQDYFNGSLKGIGVPNLHLEHIRKALIPIPPHTEQFRIVSRADMLLPLVEQIAADEAELRSLVSASKSKILDLAIRGQLVPQSPDDEPAAVLLERIRAEKEELIKQSKIKQDNKESVIFRGEDNSYYENIDGTIVSIEKDVPFELPNGWVWCRVRNIASVRGGKRLPKGTDFSEAPTTHAYIRVTDMKNRTVNTADLKYISDDVYEQIKSYTISSKDLYVTIAGTIGVVGEVPDNLDGMNLTENAVKVCDITINKKYLCYILLSSFVQQQFQDKTHQVAMPKLALERILTTLIPLPPLKEQERLVNVIDKSTSWLDGIQTVLT